MSDISQSEYDCEEESKRELAFSLDADNMGSGKTVYISNEIGSWSPVRPESVGAIMLKTACGKH